MARKLAYYLLIVGVLLLLSVAVVDIFLLDSPSTANAANDPLTAILSHPPIYQEDGDSDAEAQEEPTAEPQGTSQEESQEAPAQESEVESDEEQPSNAYCLLCHDQPGRTLTLASGEMLSLTVDPEILAGSVHGEGNPEGALACADCHENYRFPHDPLESETVREFTLERYTTCQKCHQEQYTHEQDGVHAQAIREGQVDAATCVDCHGSHDIQPPNEPRERVSLTCGQCHGAIFDEYQNSVHGKALFEGNPDVPNCIDCHGVHNIQTPTTAEFRVRSPELCATCHADEELMDKYDISTNVFDSYLTDFHGTTVALFNQQDPDVATNKAVCFDCHGVHNITPANNFKSQVAKENLLTTCQQCHPNATDDFPDAWVGHFKPTAEDNPALFAVTWFYRIIIPLTIAGFAFLVGTDVYGRVRRRLFGSGH